MLFPSHSIAQNNGRAIGVERSVGIAEIFQRFASTSDGPALRLIHCFYDARWDGQSPLHGVPLPLSHPAADLRICLVGRAVVGIEVERRIPPLRRNIGDAVAALLHVLPKSFYVSGIG